MPLTDTDINPGQHNKMKKVLFCLFFCIGIIWLRFNIYMHCHCISM